MADPLRDADAPSGQGAADRARAADDTRVDEEAAGYARADLDEALARIRGTIDPRGLEGLGRRQALRGAADGDGSLLEEIRALGERVEHLAAIAEAAAERTTHLAMASSANEERVRRLTEVIETVQAPQGRSDRRVRWLSVTVAVLAVILTASLAMELL